MEHSGFKDIQPDKAVAPMDEVDRLLAIADWEEPAPPALAMVANAFEELQGTDDVQRLLPIIGRLLQAEADSKGKMVYPTRMLRHQHIIAMMLLNPFVTRVELCRFFGVSMAVLNNIAKSDVFKTLAGQFHVSLPGQEELGEKLKDTVSAAIDIAQKHLIKSQDPDFALSIMDKGANRLGMGVKQGTQVNIQNNVVTPDMVAYARDRKRLRDASQ